MRVAHINMTDTRHSCPQELTYVNQSSKRMCIHSDQPHSVPGCSSVTFPQHGRCSLHAYQHGGTHTFYSYDTFRQTPEGSYVQGLSVTHGSRRNHICTFAAGASNDRTLYVYHCPCGHYKDALLCMAAFITCIMQSYNEYSTQSNG